MSEVMMGVLKAQVESLTRQVEQLGPENERVRKLLEQFEHRHRADEARIERLKSILGNVAQVGSYECLKANHGTLADKVRSAITDFIGSEVLK